MYYKGYLTYKNKASNSFSFKLIMTTPPEIIHSEIRHDSFVVPGRDGELYGKNTYRGDASVKVSFAIVTTGTASSYTTALNQIYSWLSGKGQLLFSDENAYYEVKKVIITTDQRTILKYGTLDVEFVVYPYKYLIENNPSTTSLTIQNTHDECCPMYQLSRTSSSSTATFTLTVNGNAMTVAVPQGVSSVYIDTRRKVAYYTSSNVNVPATVTGDYDKLKLPGNATSTLTINGFNTLTTTPRWGYEI